jgi:hypothetical protein
MGFTIILLSGVFLIIAFIFTILVLKVDFVQDFAKNIKKIKRG